MLEQRCICNIGKIRWENLPNNFEVLGPRIQSLEGAPHVDKYSWNMFHTSTKRLSCYTVASEKGNSWKVSLGD